MNRMNRYDVIVAGGGSAGIAAALASARQGAQTLLLERQTKLGGMGTSALVHTFCGLYHPDVEQPPAWLNPGIPTEIGQQMLERTCQNQPDKMGRVYVLRQHPSLFALIADELCQAEASLTVMSGTEWTGLQADGSGWKLNIITRGANRELQTAALVDTTGDATGARLLGSDYHDQVEGGRLYRPAYIATFHGVSGVHDDSWRLSLSAQIFRAVKDGKLPATVLGAGFRDSPFAGEVFLTIDLEAGQGDWDPFDPVKRAQVEQEGRRTVMALWEYLGANHQDFLTVSPPMLPTKAGIRETARYRGDYTLTSEDLVASRRFEDEVALAGWPMEKRETARGPKFRYFDEPKPAGIPAGCLRSARLPGLFFAGRCLSADHEALASVRVMGTCMATGQAAGVMAAEWARQG